MNPEFPSYEVADVFAKFDTTARVGVLELRGLIFECAAQMPEVGPIEEALRWGQPAYLTSVSKSGTTLRLGVPKTGGFAIFAHCQTTVISSYAREFAGLDRIEGNRAVVFENTAQIAPNRISMMIRHALRYHL